MDISQYRADGLLTVRDTTREAAKAPITPINAAANVQTQVSEDAVNTGVADRQSLFDTFIDTVNPLQHIPGVSTAYRAITGDQSSALAEMAGGFLFGGPVGLAAGAASSFLELVTGKDVMGHALAFFEGDGTPSGIEQLGTAATGNTESLIKPYGTSLGVEQYQAFATAKSAQNLGIGATASDVGWATNLWTDNALKEAAGLYENNQSLGRQPKHKTGTVA